MRVFLYKIKEIEDRDCCTYIEIKSGEKAFECGHYFGGVTLEGSCYSGGKFESYSNIETALTESEYSQLVKFSEDISKLGYGIKKGDKRYQSGLALYKEIQPIFNKLKSEEAQAFFEKIQEEEIEYLMDEYSLNKDEVKEIFDNYGLEYRDRSIICGIFNDTSDLGYEEAYSLGYINDNDIISSRYFDYEKFGEDLVNEDERYYQLDDGRVVILSY